MVTVFVWDKVGVVKLLPLPKATPPVGAENHSTVLPAIGLANSTTVPEPQLLPFTTEVGGLGLATTITRTVLLNNVVHCPVIALKEKSKFPAVVELKV